MKRLFGSIIVLLAVLAIALPSVQAYEIGYTRLAGYSSGNGGEFTIIPVGSWPYDINGLYSSDTKNKYSPTPNFQSFCLEETEEAHHGFVTFDEAAILGGGGPNPDPISWGSAWLYLQFAQGTLAGYNFTVGAGRETSAAALQEAFWYLEDENTINPATNTFLNLLVTQFSLPSITNAKSDNYINHVAQYPVIVINPYHFDDTGRIVNDQSFMTLVPEPGSMLLLGIGLLGLAFANRRRKNS